MPLSVADLAVPGKAPITILSTTFPNVYLRMDGTGVTTWNGSGSGIVNCQFGAGPYEKFKVLPQADGSFAFASATFSNVHLRMDAAELPQIPGGRAVGPSTARSTWVPTRRSSFSRRQVARSPSSRRCFRIRFCAWSASG